MNATAKARETFEAPEVQGLRTYVDDMIGARVPMSRIAVEAGVAVTRLKLWHAGNEDPEIIAPLEAWRAETEAAGMVDAGHVMTPTAREIVKAFDRARAPKGGAANLDGDVIQQRGIALIFGASAVGKTATAEWYERQQNSLRVPGVWPTVLVRCTGEEKSLHAVHSAIIRSMERRGFYLQPHSKLRDSILDHVPQGGLIIFDEAQLLHAKRMDELRYFPDKCGIAIAFMGNLTGYKELIDAKMAQMMSRVGGSRVVIDIPKEGDVDALLDAWEMRGRKLRELALMIGLQDGGLRKLHDAVSMAGKLAHAKGKPVDFEAFEVAAEVVGALAGAA